MAGSREIQKRQRTVLRMYLRGLDANEVSKKTGIEKRTVYRDLEEVRIFLAQEIHAKELWPLRQSVEMRLELIRKSWHLYYKRSDKRMEVWNIPRHTKDGVQVETGKKETEIESFTRKLKALHEIGEFCTQLDKLAFPNLATLSELPPETQPRFDMIKFDRLDEKDREIVVSALKIIHRIRSESNSDISSPSPDRVTSG